MRCGPVDMWICMLDYFVANNKFVIGVSYTKVPLKKKKKKKKS